MAWAGSYRRARLPGNWDGIRAQVLMSADYSCEWVRTDTGLRCGRYANQCDHIIAGDDHSRENLQALCEWHHARKSATEGARATNSKRPKRERAVKLTPFEARAQAQHARAAIEQRERIDNST